MKPLLNAGHHGRLVILGGPAVANRWLGRSASGQLLPGRGFSWHPHNLSGCTGHCLPLPGQQGSISGPPPPSVPPYMLLCWSLLTFYPKPDTSKAVNLNLWVTLYSSSLQDYYKSEKIYLMSPFPLR